MSDLFDQSLWVISGSVFVGGIVGSPHCFSMCGPIVVNFAQQRSHLLIYQLGRMTAYVLAGSLVGAFGGSLLDRGRPEWVSAITLGTIALLLMFNGYRAIVGRPLHIATPGWMIRFFGKLWSVVRMPFVPKSVSAAVAGFLTVFLPCGHLYSFLLGASVTGSAVKGAIFMFAFWLGSAPLLSASGGILQKLLGSSLKRNGQRWAGALLVVSGLLSVVAFGYRAENFAKPVTSESKAQSHRCH